MNHIKSYKLFENKDNLQEVIETVKDICLELQDDGYTIDLDFHPASNYNILIIKKLSSTIVNGNPELLEFNLSDVREVIDRLLEYLSRNRDYIDKDSVKINLSPSFYKKRGGINKRSNSSGWQELWSPYLKDKVLGVKIYF